MLVDLRVEGVDELVVAAVELPVAEDDRCRRGVGARVAGLDRVLAAPHALEGELDPGGEESCDCSLESSPDGQENCFCPLPLIVTV